MSTGSRGRFDGKTHIREKPPFLADDLEPRSEHCVLRTDLFHHVEHELRIRSHPEEENDPDIVIAVGRVPKIEVEEPLFGFPGAE